MLAMTTPLTSSSKVLLLPETQHAAPGGSSPVRRYRIARLRAQTPAPSDGRQFEYLKRSFD